MLQLNDVEIAVREIHKEEPRRREKKKVAEQVVRKC